MNTVNVNLNVNGVDTALKLYLDTHTVGDRPSAFASGEVAVNAGDSVTLHVFETAASDGQEVRLTASLLCE